MVTYFSMEWKSERLQKNASSILIVDGRKRRITFAEFAMCGDVLEQWDGPLQASSGAQFFSDMTEALSQWNGRSDFSEPAVSNFWWKIKLRERSGKIHRIKGSTACPPFGITIEKELQSLCIESGIRGEWVEKMCGFKDMAES